MKAFTTVFAIILAFTFTSCFHDRPGAAKHKNKDDIEAHIIGSVIIDRQYMRINGKSDLEKGTKVQIVFDEKIIGNTKVKKDGKIEEAFPLEKRNQPSILALIVKPELQSHALQKIFGEKGEHLVGPYTFTYTEEGISHTGLKSITKIDKYNPHSSFDERYFVTQKMLDDDETSVLFQPN